MEWLIGFLILAWLVRGKGSKSKRSSSLRRYKPARTSYTNPWQKRKKLNLKASARFGRRGKD
jgi:hypothetical protein